MSDIRWTDKVWLDSDGNINSLVMEASKIPQKDENVKLKEDMKLIKDAINDPNKNGFDICRLIKNITDEYDFEEEEE